MAGRVTMICVPSSGEEGTRGNWSKFEVDAIFYLKDPYMR